MLKRNRRLLLQAVCLTLGAGLCGIGLVRGEADIVLQKAVKICLECIGIG